MNIKSDGKERKHIPWVVWYIVITIFAQYILINYKESIKFIDTNVFILMGAPDSVNIYKGQYWGVLTNNFLHIYLSQLIINYIGIIIFGYFIERRIGFIKFSFIVILACIIPSIIQLNLTNQPGIGLSGVNFTLFGYIISKSIKNKEFRLKWISVYLTIMVLIVLYFNIYNIYTENVYRTEAMSFGFLFGLLLGFLSNRKIWVQSLVLFNIIFFAVSTLWYAPWSTEWQVYKGVEAHKTKQYKSAKKRYDKALKLDPNNKQALKNLELLKLDKLKLKAYKAHMKEDYQEAKEIYEEILEISPNDKWAKEGYNELP